MRCVVALAVVVAARQAGACDAAEVARLTMRAARYEARHQMGEAIALRTTVAACPRSAVTESNALALARDHAAIGDYERAATLIETAARTNAADAPLRVAMTEAVQSRLALGHLTQAIADARWLLQHNADAAPALDVGESLERAHQWRTAQSWYRGFLRRPAHPDERDLRARALIGLGRTLDALHQNAQADHVRHRAIALVVPDTRAESMEETDEAGGVVAPPNPFWLDAYARVYTERDEQLRDAVAEAHLHAAVDLAARCQRPRPPVPQWLRERSFYDWERQVRLPWASASTECSRRVLKLASEVTDLAVPTWTRAAEVLAAAQRAYHQSHVVVVDMPPYLHWYDRAYSWYERSQGIIHFCSGSEW